MPKSKRSRVVALTKKVSTNPRERKEKLMDDVQQAVDEYENLFVFEFNNMRSNFFKELRAEWSDSRFFLGKNRVMQLALGLDSETEFRPGLCEAAQDVTGHRGLLFTNRSQDEVVAYFAEYGKLDYARAGATATATVSMSAGPIEGMTHTMTPTLTKLGMPVKLMRGVIVNTADFDICRKGDTLTPEAARLLKLFEKPLVTFRLTLISCWSAADNQYRSLATAGVAAGAAASGGPVELDLKFD